MILHRTFYYLGYPLGRFADLKHRQLVRQVGETITTGRIRRTFSSSKSVCSFNLLDGAGRSNSHKLLFDDMHLVIQSTNSARSWDVSSVCSNNSPSRFCVKSPTRNHSYPDQSCTRYLGKSANTVHPKARLVALSLVRNHY
jgi:hypothetical protein